MLLMRMRIDTAILEVSPAIPPLGTCERDSYTALSETHTELRMGVGRWDQPKHLSLKKWLSVSTYRIPWSSEQQD